MVEFWICLEAYYEKGSGRREYIDYYYKKVRGITLPRVGETIVPYKGAYPVVADEIDHSFEPIHVIVNAGMNVTNNAEIRLSMIEDLKREGGFITDMEFDALVVKGEV